MSNHQTDHVSRPWRRRTAVCALGALALLSACQDDDSASPATTTTVVGADSGSMADTAAATTPSTTLGAAGTTTTTIVSLGFPGADEAPIADPDGDTSDLPDPVQPGGSFSDGHWEVTWMSDYLNNSSAGDVSVDGHIEMEGSGTIDIAGGIVTAGDLTQTGSSNDAVVTTAGVDAVVSGEYWIKGTVDGTAAAPILHASSGFDGTVTTGGKDYDSHPDFGVFTGDAGTQMVIVSATENYVTGDWVTMLPRPDLEAGFSATLVGTFTATKSQCAADGPTVPTYLWQTELGSADAPTIVELDVDPDVAASPALMDAFRLAVDSWNGMLGRVSAGARFAIGTSTGDHPVVHVAFDSPDFVGMSTQSGGTLQPVPEDHAAQMEPTSWTDAGERHLLDEGYLRLNGHIDQSALGDQTWDELATTEPRLVQHVFEHELGHALGLGHSDDANSVMWSQPGSLAERTFASSIGCDEVRAILGLATGG